MADEEAVPGAEGPLVAVTFQKTPHQKQKYLESEPKALGVTQIALSVFYISSVIVILTNSISMVVEDLTKIIGSVFVIIAGSLAIAAQNLHLPTLKACLGMQVVACVASVINLIVSVSDMAGHEYGYSCWKYVEINSTDHDDSCYSITASTEHYLAELVLINTALIAISVTLAAYCCKVVNCCSPGQRMVSQCRNGTSKIRNGLAIDEEAVPDVEGPLVAVTFQRNPHQKQKYLESQPKALGVTQIALSVFYISSVIVILTNGLSMVVLDPPQIIGSVFVIIAGSLAIAAQNLHLPTLKACLGMQVVACVASVFNLIVSVARMEARSYFCWKYGEGNLTDYDKTCILFNNSATHYFAELILIQTALIAISVTLAAYCCKVVNCCSPGPRMPVITVQVPPAQQ
ncbi:uncharacterized protein LOC129852932 [Salvelinus fontinalis]|uniref:uncharacterized protein LOC129852932 n=2 Tax=Salvelinus TaxID=8033 RepID=UPI002485AB1E|nr:uncharacterized protein LOC129852932 [Salvelinus fontinalis]